MCERDTRNGYPVAAVATTDMSTSTEPPLHARAAAQPSLRAFVMLHKGISLAALALILVFIGLTVPALFGRGSWKVSDSSACSTWSSANQTQQAQYARLYVSEHGPLRSGATAPASIEAAINSGCVAAYAYDEADTVNVVQAIKGDF